MLTNRYLEGIPADSRVKTDGRFLKEDMLSKEKLESIRKLNHMAEERGESLAQMALKWVMKDKDVTSVLIGVSKPEQIVDNLKMMEGSLFTEEELIRIDRFSL